MSYKLIEKKNIFKTLKNSHIEIGIITDATHGVDDKTGLPATMVDVAKHNESIFSFMSNPKIDNLKKRLGKITNYTIIYLSTRTGKSKVLKESEELIKKPMRTRQYHNTPYTIAKKGFDMGTIETWAMYNYLKAIFIRGNNK